MRNVAGSALTVWSTISIWQPDRSAGSSSNFSARDMLIFAFDSADCTLSTVAVASYASQMVALWFMYAPHLLGPAINSGRPREPNPGRVEQDVISGTQTT